VPVARSSHSLTAVGSSLFLLGGENVPRVPLGSDVYEYSWNGVWNKVAVRFRARPPFVPLHDVATAHPPLPGMEINMGIIEECATSRHASSAARVLP
jgi:hypothetical protein